MALSAAMGSLIHAEAELDGLACVDLRTGAVLSASTRDEASRRALEVAAQVALQLCAAPPMESGGRADGHLRETFVVSSSAVHVYALSRRRPGCVLVGTARGGANVALVLSSIRALAETLVDLDA